LVTQNLTINGAKKGIWTRQGTLCSPGKSLRAFARAFQDSGRAFSHDISVSDALNHAVLILSDFIFRQSAEKMEIL
jgi:hypothetical protein